MAGPFKYLWEYQIEINYKKIELKFPSHNVKSYF